MWSKSCRAMAGTLLRRRPSEREQALALPRRLHELRIVAVHVARIEHRPTAGEVGIRLERLAQLRVVREAGLAAAVQVQPALLRGGLGRPLAQQAGLPASLPSLVFAVRGRRGLLRQLLGPI